jgi:hypothetical protein
MVPSCRHSLVAGHVLLGEIEHTGDVLHLAIGHLEHFLEGVDLVHGDDAVGLGHLGAERDHTDGEGHLVLGRPVLLLVAVDDVVPGDAAEQSADRSADCEPRRGAGQLSPNRHCRNSSRHVA